jgi:hypothetical protein
MTIAHMGIYDYLSQLNDRIRTLKTEKARAEQVV